MTLSKLVLIDNTYRSPRRSFQGIKVNNLGNIQKSLEFAKNMTLCRCVLIILTPCSQELHRKKPVSIKLLISLSKLRAGENI